MNTIKFSHNYPKLHGQTGAVLLAVVPIRIDRNTPKELLEYDTTYYESVSLGGSVVRHFPLPTGDYIQLIFLGNLGIPFCTIRKAWPKQKVEHYNSKIGETFAIQIKETANVSSNNK